MKPWLRWWSKAEVPQWVMCQEPTELLWMGCLTELIWIRRLKSSTSSPNTNSQTYWPKVIWHMTNGIIFFICSTHQPFQLHLLRWEFQLDKLHHNDGAKDAGARRRKKCGKIEIYSDEPVFSCFRQVPHPLKVWLHPKVRGYSWLRGNRRAGWQDIQNPTQRRVLKRDCKMHTLAFWWRQPRGKPVATKEESGDVTGTRVAFKKATEKRHTIYTCLQPQFTIRKQSSRSSGENLRTKNMTTLWTIWAWTWLFGAYFWMPLFEQQFILDKTVRRVYDTCWIIFGTVWDCHSMKLQNWSVNKKKSLV